MYDKSLVLEILEQILNSSKIIQDSFGIVDSSDYFLNSPQGLEKIEYYIVA